MWAKIEVFDSGQRIIQLPSEDIAHEENGEIQFGGRSVPAMIRWRNDLQSCGSSFEEPVTVLLSDKLRKDLLIPESPVYQLAKTDAGVSFGPVIGLLLGSATLRYNPIHMEKYSDRFGVYSQIGGLVYAFSPKLINWSKQTVYGLYFNHETALWEYGCFPLPQVIYRRDFHTDPDVIRKLVAYTGGRLFNSYRFSKYELYDLIKVHPELREYLPPTEYSMEFDQLKRFIDTHQKVILKPVHLSRGRGICIIEKMDSKYKVIDFRARQPMTYELYNDRLLANFFDVYQDLFDKYIIQRYLPLANVDGAPYDIRVVTHKRGDRTWSLTGIECRVSNNGYLTNISRGGYALPLDEALKRSFGGDEERMARQVEDLCLTFCRFMDTSGEHFAEFGLDIAIDADQKLWLIEANVFPSFKGFKRMDHDIYLAIRYRPMFYAASLAMPSITLQTDDWGE